MKEFKYSRDSISDPGIPLPLYLYLNLNLHSPLSLSKEIGLKKLKKIEWVLRCDTYEYIYMFHEGVGFSEIDVDLIRFWNNNQYYGSSSGHNPAAASGSFRDINCRSFQSGAGLLPSPLKSCSSTEIITKMIKFEEKVGCLVDDFQPSERWAGPAYSNSPPPSSLPMPNFSLRPKRTVSLDLPTAASEFDLHLVSKSAPVSPTRERSPSPSDMFDSASFVTKMMSSDLFDSADSAKKMTPSDLSDSATKTLRRILNLEVSDE
ncbi:hypothetical protein Adt_01563 [Abeliophyllum distichum]|uniref:Uncharacterized protein n=1 Tax=Abeliophyllum distichum TaxID=126358 RepID=A0ABD1VT73_9LAMI